MQDIEITEVWKDIKGFEGHYQVSNLGNVRSCDRVRKGRGDSVVPLKGKLMNFKLKFGYREVHLRNNEVNVYWTVHRMVAKAFIPNPDNLPVVNHKDGNKLNNKVDNLEWATFQQNAIHAIENGLSNVHNGKAIYTPEFKQKVFDYKNQTGCSIMELSRVFNISPRTAGRIAQGMLGEKTTSRLVDGELVVRKALTEEQIKEIRKLRKEGLTLEKIAKMYDRGISQIARLTSGCNTEELNE
jgi:hypothetical protein